MKKRKFADGGVAEAMAQMQLSKALASGKKMPPPPPAQEPPPPMSPAQAQEMMGPATSATTPSMAELPNSRFSPRGRAGVTRQYANGGSVNSKASSRADGCAQRGKTKGRMV